MTTDAVLIERLLRNLIDNAFKCTDCGEACVAVEAAGSAFRVSVRDTGRGIPVEAQGRVFEEFHQVDNAGGDRACGLGLAIVARLSALIGLSVTLEFEPGRGTTLSLTMPGAAAVAEEEPLDALRGAGLQGLKVRISLPRSMPRAAAASTRRTLGRGTGGRLRRRDRRDLQTRSLRLYCMPGCIRRDQLGAMRFADGDDCAEQRDRGGARGDSGGEAVDQGAAQGVHRYLPELGLAMAGLCERNRPSVL